MLPRYFATAILLAASTSNVLAQSAPAASFDHLAIYVADLDRSVSFYKRLFGFGEVNAPVPFARWLTMGNGSTLHIVDHSTGNRCTFFWGLII